MRPKSSPPTTTLQVLKPTQEGNLKQTQMNQNRCRELQIVGPTRSKPLTAYSLSPSPPSSSWFQLPAGWIVKKRYRRSTGRIDKYYFEPGTGQQFRSLVSIQRYLNGERSATPRRKKNSMKPKLATITTTKPKTTTTTKRKLGNKKNMQIVPHTAKCGSLFGLPDGWLVEEKPRKNINYIGIVDRYYIELGTGRKFRSLISAQRYVNEEKSYEFTLKAFQLANQITKKKSNDQKNNGLQIVVKHQADDEGEDPASKALKPGNRSVMMNKSIGEDLSLQVVVKRPADDETNDTASKALKPASDSTHLKSSGFQENFISRKEGKSCLLDFSIVAPKVKWVLNGPAGNTWSAFVNDSVVPETVKQNWSETFLSTLDESC